MLSAASSSVLSWCRVAGRAVESPCPILLLLHVKDAAGLAPGSRPGAECCRSRCALQTRPQALRVRGRDLFFGSEYKLAEYFGHYLSGEKCACEELSIVR